MLGVKFEGTTMENKVKAYADAIQSAGIRGSIRIPGYAVNRDGDCPFVKDGTCTVVFTYVNKEDYRRLVDLADSLPVNLISGLVFATNWEYENEDSYENHRRGGLCIDL